VADLRASVTALAVSRAETKIGVADLLATVAALAASRAETKISVADLLASETAIAGLETLAHELARARDAAVRANQTKSRFLAGMSHELRTPLHAVLGYAQLLRQDGGLNEVQSARVTSMLAAGMHLLEMIEGVLDLSEIEAGRVELNVAAVNLRRVADACLDLVRPAAEAKQLTLGLAIPLDVPHYLTTDPKRLRQVLLNLLGNAVKYTLRGAVELRMHIADEGASLRFEVVDTGPGIAAEHHDRLFQEFGRLDASPTSMIEGSGLGLSLSKQLATLMGGLVGHDDNPGGGSIFWLELPLIRYDEAAPNPAAALDIRQVRPAPTRTLRVLVVDDMAMNLDIAAAFIRSAGHEATCVDSGAQAIEAVRSTDFDVVVMDVRMPEMDGLEATRRIRALEGVRGRVPIVALTAQAFTDQVAECRKAGMDGHLAKPFDPDTLLAAVVQAVNAGLRGV
jgi:signal transduction histidine kinase/CheY-like chemotaxis protein